MAATVLLRQVKCAAIAGVVNTAKCRVPEIVINQILEGLDDGKCFDISRQGAKKNFKPHMDKVGMARRFLRVTDEERSYWPFKRDNERYMFWHPKGESVPVSSERQAKRIIAHLTVILDQ